ncbi:hypothetical protein SDC9_147183 [bioreactor metagenome]|uniref:HTH crp-type domain-containing protein n=1 Tax=bioreactor metagenome TaxID=1076179 RepID=A0A645EFU2_9ZZZZ
MIVKPGCIFGEVSYFTHMPFDTGAEAIVDSKIYVIPYSVISAYLVGNPDVNMALSLSLSRKLRACTQVIDNLVMKNATAMVVTYLKYIANAHGEKDANNKIRINIKFTHEDVASITNLSRVTVSNIFSDLFKLGILEKRDGKVYIQNILKLDAMIEDET